LFALLPKQSKAMGRAGARAVDLPARSFDLAPPGVAPPLPLGRTENKTKAEERTHKQRQTDNILHKTSLCY